MKKGLYPRQLRLTLRTPGNLSDKPRLLTHGFQHIQKRLGAPFGYHNGHTNTIIEGACHLPTLQMTRILQPSKNRGKLPTLPLQHCLAGIGNNPDHIFIDTTGGDMGKSIDFTASKNPLYQLRIDAGGDQELFAQALFKFGYITIDGKLHRIKTYMANRGKSRAMQTRRGDTDNLMTHMNLGAIHNLMIIDGPHNKPGHIVFTRGIHTGNIGRLSTNEGTPRLTTPFGDPLNQGLYDRITQTTLRDIIEKEERLCPLDQDIVDARGHQIDAHSIMLPHQYGDMKFGTHPIGGTHQHRLLHTR